MPLRPFVPGTAGRRRRHEPPASARPARRVRCCICATADTFTASRCMV